MHQSLISFRGLLLTRDTAHAIELLEAKAGEHGWKVRLVGPTPGSCDGDPISLVPAGRQIHMFLEQGDSSKQAALNALWGFAVPLGFTPECRYPLSHNPSAHVFHYFGPWRALHDRLFAEGRGHLAWPSVCCAAQCAVGQWKGFQTLERTVQALLHCAGRNCGPIDGIIGPRTAAAIQSLGLGHLTSLEDLIHNLEQLEPSQQVASNTHQTGHIALPDRQMVVAATGAVKVVKTKQGAILTVDGPGRVVLDIGGPL